MDTLQQKEQILEEQYDMYNKYITLDKLWNKVFCENNKDSEYRAFNFIDDITATYSLEEIKQLTQTDADILLLSDFVYEFDYVKGRYGVIFNRLEKALYESNVANVFSILEKQFSIPKR